MEQVKVKQKKKKVKDKSVDDKSANEKILENKPRIEPKKENVHIESENAERPSTSDPKSTYKNDTLESDISKINTSDESNSILNTTDSSCEIMHDVMTLTDDETFEVVTENTPPNLEKSDLTQKTSQITTVEKPSAPSYKELGEIVNKFQVMEIEAEKKTIEKVNKEVTPFCFEEIENIFGMNEIVRARAFSVQFEKYELQSPSHTHPLYEALTEYQRARSRLIANEKKIEATFGEYKQNLSCVWCAKECTKKSSDKCGDGFYYSESYNYIDATFQDSIFVDLQNDLNSLRNKVGEIHSLYSHSEHFLKIQIDELIWNSIVNGSLSMKESLQILFWVLRTSGWGYDKVLRHQLRRWCCYLANALLEKDNSLNNSLLILHHILRISQGIRWALHLVRCKVDSVNDIQNAICMLETILLHSKINPEQCQSEGSSFNVIEDSNDQLVVAREADESLWTVVDSDGEGADVDTSESNKIVLKESDIVALIKQIPFKNIFKELMCVKNNGIEDLFCGSNLSAGSILKTFAANRLILKIIRSALLVHKNYLELTKELCRLALHCVMYCTDLWESSNSKCEANLYERVSVEYNNVFLAGWSTIKAARSKDISHMFFSELPFKLCLIQHVSDLFKSLYEQLVVSDSVQCYYTLVTFSNMAISRTEEDFIITVVKNLFEIGYISDFSELGCGEWARTVCGSVLHATPQFTGIVLNMVTQKISHKWLNDLPLNLWRPELDELMDILNNWAMDKTDLIPFLLKALDWKCQGGLPLHIQQSVAIFLCTLAEKLSRPKKPPPEWIWECILILKLHLVEWEINIASAQQPDALCNLDLTGKCQITNFALILMSSWGHSYPQIFQNAAPHLIKLANSGRFTEVIHVIYYVIPILSEIPDSIKECKIFKELLYIIIQAEKSYTKIATRFVTQDFPGPIVKMLADMIRFQLHYYSKFKMTTINCLVSIWINWLTSQDNWESDWIIVYLLDVVLGCCFLHYNCMVDAGNIFRQLIQSKLPTSPKSTTSSSLSNWLWNSSSSFKGLIQCNIEAPFLSHMILWIEHSSIERETGIWQKLIERLTFHEEGNKVNIDKTLRTIGGGDTSNNLIIYRSLQCAINTSISHPIVTLLWQLFFYLYLDNSFLNPDAQQKHVGPLFFQGLINSRLLFKAKARLIESKTYHEKKIHDLSKNENIQNKKQNERIAYHTQQSKLMNTFHVWFDENFFQNYNSGSHCLDPHFSKMCALMAGYNNTWNDTIDMYELENYQNSSYSMTIADLEKYDIDDSSEPSSLNKNHATGLLPGEKVIQRLKTYEDPVLEATENFESNKLASIIDPSLFKDSNKVFSLIKHNLKEIMKHARKYFVVNHKLNEIDVILFKILPTLYEKQRFLKVYDKSCGTNCIKSAKITLQGSESIFKTNIKENINANRNLHETVISEITQPYKDLAEKTAILSKLAQLTCNESILNNECGIVFFNIIMDTLNEDIMKFPPAKQILNTLVSHLGEKFISGNGRQCVALINHYKDLENVNIVCSLLRPLELPPQEMIDLYETISMSVTNTHVAFSCLSKFRISNWLKDTRPSITDRSKLLKHICTALGNFGNDPPEDRLSVQELLCVHLSGVLSWEFPVHLSQVITQFSELTLDQKLPPSCWEHCITTIETYPHLVTHRIGSRIMELFGHQWWSKRNNNGSSGLHSTYEIYIPSVARLGAILSSTILNSAMLHQPLLLTHQITSVVFNAMSAYWNVWLVPWWGGIQPVWQIDTRNPIILPWNVSDIKGPETILDAFVETLSYCINTLPGSNIDFLRLTWQWYLNSYPNILVSPHILNKVHKALLQLPWSSDSNQWMTFTDLQVVSQICNNNLPLCHAFILQCLKDKKWEPWIAKHSHLMQANALFLLLPVFFKMRSEKNVLFDAMSLPWNLLNYENFEEILNWFMYTFKSPLKPFYSDEMFLLLCAMAGFKNQSDCSESWQIRRVCLIKAWVNNLALYSQEIIDAKQKIIVNESIATNVTDLLNKIEKVVSTLVNSSENQKISECTQLLNAAIMMLNTVTLQDIAIQSWTNWVVKASKISIMGLISCILNVTQKNMFANLAEFTLMTYFATKGKWAFIKDVWKNNCIVSIDYLISNNFLLTSMATYISLDRTKYDGKMFDQIDKRIIQIFHNIEPKSTFETKICLWICYMVSLTCNASLSVENSKYVFENVSIILEKWSQEPSWEILKAIRLVQNVSPSYKFRAITRYVYCAITDLHDKIHGNSSAAYMNNGAFCKIASSLESMIEQKQNSDIKHILIKYAEYSKDKSHTRENIQKRVTDICIEIYSDTNYLMDTFELF